MKVANETLLKIIKDEHLVINRCITIGKHNGDFNFIATSKLFPFSKGRKSSYINKRCVRVEIMNIKTDSQARIWKKVVFNIVKGTVYRVSKCYFDRANIATYYLTVPWREMFTEVPEDYSNYVVPPPSPEIAKKIKEEIDARKN